MQLGAADANLLGQHVDIEVAIRQILVNGFHNTFHQQLVVALDLRRLHLVCLHLCTAVLALQALARLKQVLDIHAQFLHVEGLGQEGIGAALETFETIADIGH